jgi:hypothetical protein
MKRAARIGPSLLASRGDPERRLTAWVPPCSRSVPRKSGTARGKASASLPKQLERVARPGLLHIAMDTHEVIDKRCGARYRRRFSVCVSRSNPLRRRRGFRRPPRSPFPLAGGEERAVACRGAPPLPAMSLGTHTCRLGKGRRDNRRSAAPPFRGSAHAMFGARGRRGCSSRRCTMGAICRRRL